jgi:hypothetical protein
VQSKLLQLMKYHFRHIPSIITSQTSNIRSRIELDVLQELHGATIFKDHEQHFDDSINYLDSHCISLMKSAIRLYLKLRLHHSATLTTIVTSGPSIRHKLTKEILFRHQ